MTGLSRKARRAVERAAEDLGRGTYSTREVRRIETEPPHAWAEARDPISPPVHNPH